MKHIEEIYKDLSKEYEGYEILPPIIIHDDIKYFIGFYLKKTQKIYLVVCDIKNGKICNKKEPQYVTAIETDISERELRILLLTEQFFDKIRESILKEKYDKEMYNSYKKILIGSMPTEYIKIYN